MTKSELDAMPLALLELAGQIDAPDYVPAMCLRDAAAMIQQLRRCVADAVRRPMGVIPDSAAWLTDDELAHAERRRRGNEAAN